MADTLNVSVREQLGTNHTRRLRWAGQVPAILYGHGEKNVNLSIAATEVNGVIRHGAKVVDIRGAVTDSALIRDVQWDALGSTVIHLDLTRVSADEKVEVTVQVEPQEGSDPAKTATEVAAQLAREPGFVKVNVLSLEQSGALLEPWLGSSDGWKALPIPRLIAIELDRSAAPDLDAVRTRLNTSFKGVSLDDHRQWQRQIRTVTRSFALGGLAILLLVGAATTAIIISATKSSMASNREIVEVLHFVGATDRFIAREFEKHFLRLGIRAGLVGAVSAMAVFLAIPWVVQVLGGGSVTMAEMHRLIGAGTLDAAGYVLLIIVVVIIAALCMITSRLGVYAILNSRD